MEFECAISENPEEKGNLYYNIRNEEKIDIMIYKMRTYRELVLGSKTINNAELLKSYRSLSADNKNV